MGYILYGKVSKCIVSGMVTALTEIFVIIIISLYIASYNQLVLEVINFEKSTFI